MKDPEYREWQRQQFWQGQGLHSCDLNDLAARQDNLRWWHNRSVLHDAYGVVEGLDFGYVAGLGEATVSPGLAYDCYGRELLLCEPCTVALPEGELPSEGLTLLIAHPEDGSVQGPNAPAGGCLPADCRPADACRSLKWLVGGRVSIRDGVALGQIEHGEHGPRRCTSFRPYPTCRQVRPYIANGATVSGNMPWRPWMLTLGEGLEPRMVGIEAPVDTSKAAFSETPCYFAWHQGSLWKPAEAQTLSRVFVQSRLFVNARSRITMAPTDMPRLMQLLNGALAHVAEPEPERFLYRIWLPFLGRVDSRSVGVEQLLLFGRQVTVCWLGIERLAGASEVEHGDIRRNRFC